MGRSYKMNLSNSSARSLDPKLDELTPDEYKKMIDQLKAWATPRRHNSKTATGLANARLIEKIAEDGRVTKQDEHAILNSINCQRGWWQILILMDTLIMSILLPVLVYEEPPDNGHFSESMRDRLSLAYYTCLSFAFYSSILQLVATLLIYALTSYLNEMKSIIYLFIQCHDLFVYLNTGGITIVAALILSAMLGHILMVGPVASIPSCFFGTVAFLLILYIYAKVIKPIFFNIFNTESGQWRKKAQNRDIQSDQSKRIAAASAATKGPFRESVRCSVLFDNLSASFKHSLAEEYPHRDEGGDEDDEEQAYVVKEEQRQRRSVIGQCFSDRTGFTSSTVSLLGESAPSEGNPFDLDSRYCKHGQSVPGSLGLDTHAQTHVQAHTAMNSTHQAPSEDEHEGDRKSSVRWHSGCLSSLASEVEV